MDSAECSGLPFLIWTSRHYLSTNNRLTCGIGLVVETLIVIKRTRQGECVKGKEGRLRTGLCGTPVDCKRLEEKGLLTDMAGMIK